ncbi:hypothetical protein [Sutcliffiella rhizosphaerae]|uniref:DUF1192 domain-containing protein n=1 Tax=Sutcliffiella rhizosphaerae TaxID=2880967 RepID=A0ABM8YLZ2_9BACI|nr:hypothetical protein [Sutcliffiella rhizosphaerae]CAG9620842.1 hypothetical protein BACCIP111883_01613 [Sutcliffiella rhizosphaerae]
MSEEKVTYSSNLPERISAVEASVTTLVGQIVDLKKQVEKLEKEKATAATVAFNKKL